MAKLINNILKKKSYNNFIIAFFGILHAILSSITFYIGTIKSLKMEKQIDIMQKIIVIHIIILVITFVFKLVTAIQKKKQDTLTFEIVISILMMIIAYKYQSEYQKKENEERKQFIIRTNIVFLLQTFILLASAAGFVYGSFPLMSLMPLMLLK